MVKIKVWTSITNVETDEFIVVWEAVLARREWGVGRRRFGNPGTVHTR
jgi:hypothetical protein